jgi:hypothetical protein
MSRQAPEQIPLPLYLKGNEEVDSADENRLIELAQEGNFYATEKVYEKYKNLLFGPFIQNLINYNFNGSNAEDNEDAHSILTVIFMEAIKSFKPGKSKFSTYLTLRVKWKFRTKLYKERLISLNNNESAKKIVKKLEERKVILVGTTDEMPVVGSAEPMINFRIDNEDFSMPVQSFIDGPFIKTCKEVLSPNEFDIYSSYLGFAKVELRGALEKTAKRFSMSTNNIGRYVRACNTKVSQALNIERFLLT